MAVVAVLGGAGRIARSVAAIVAAHPSVESIVLAGRAPRALDGVARDLGAKARTVTLDLTDPAGLAALLDGVDLLVNGAGPYPETLLPVLEAAIGAGVDYLDFDEEWGPAEQAFRLDGAAKEAGVAAVIGAGSAPGLTTLLAVRAARQLDRCEGVRIAWRVDIERMIGTAAANLRRWRETGDLGATFLSILGGLARPMPVFRNARRVEIEGFSELTEIALPQGGAMEVWPFGTFEPLTLPAHLPGVRNVSAHMAFGPGAIRPLFETIIRRLAADEIDLRSAAVEIFEALESEPERWLAWGEDEIRFGYCVDALGTKAGRPARYACTPNRIARPPGRTPLGSGLTAPFAALCVLELVERRAGGPGVHAAGDCFEADAMLTALARLDPPPIDPAEPLIERLDWLE